MTYVSRQQQGNTQCTCSNRYSNTVANMIADIPQHLQDGAYSQPRIAVGLARNRFGREGGGGDAGGEGGRGWKVQGTYLLTHLTIMVPTAMLCAASSIHHSPFSHREVPEDTFCPTSSVKSGWATGNSPAHAPHVLPCQVRHLRQGHMQPFFYMQLTAWQLHEMNGMHLCDWNGDTWQTPINQLRIC